MSAANGGALQAGLAPERVVSLVPSLTESMFDLGLGDHLVGVTDYCIYPQGKVDRVPKVGGTKNPRLEEVFALAPDLVLANQEENTPETVNVLRQAGIAVWVSFPKTVRESLATLQQLVGLYANKTSAMVLKSLEQTVDWAVGAAQSQAPVLYFCPIWQDRTQQGVDWWMTFNRDTYAHDLLGLLGGKNVFADRERRYPLAADLGTGVATGADPHTPEHEGRDSRYPRLPDGEIQAAQPELILLPSEPFAFTQAQRTWIMENWPDLPAVRQRRVHLVDGSLITWHGTRLGRAIQKLPEYFL